MGTPLRRWEENWDAHSPGPYGCTAYLIKTYEKIFIDFRERGRETSIVCLSYTPLLGIKPEAYAGALMGSRTLNLLRCGMAFQPAEQHWAGQECTSSTRLCRALLLRLHSPVLFRGSLPWGGRCPGTLLHSQGVELNSRRMFLSLSALPG